MLWLIAFVAGIVLGVASVVILAALMWGNPFQDTKPRPGGYQPKGSNTDEKPPPREL